MRFRFNLFFTFPPSSSSFFCSCFRFPNMRSTRIRWLRFFWKWYKREVLKESDEEKGSFVVCKLFFFFFKKKKKINYSLVYDMMDGWVMNRTCWPRQILGPALKGKKMNGFGMRYFWRRSSKNRSGSNSRAIITQRNYQRRVCC